MNREREREENIVVDQLKRGIEVRREVRINLHTSYLLMDFHVYVCLSILIVYCVLI